jgi:putative transposase
MSETLDPVVTELDQRQLAEQLLAKEHGVELVGPNGLLNQLTKNVLETALDAEMTEHLGYDKHDLWSSFQVKAHRLWPGECGCESHRSPQP